jgi:8-oxo-dGTP pyrophosphatase MutT (NUDIX family)
MVQRVRAILVTPDSNLLLIKRVRPGLAPYWVLPGGHVEDEDDGLEAALAREIQEEVAGVPDIAALVYVLYGEQATEFFYLARITTWSFADRTGPEFSEIGRGEYQLEEVPLTATALEAVDIKPAEVAALLRATVLDESDGHGLFGLPDLRHTEPAA